MSNVIFKDVSLEDLRKDYKTRHGFVLKSSYKSSDESIEKLCNNLISFGITKEYPEFVSRVGEECIVFVYGDDFDSPTFLKRADLGNMLHRIYQVESLVNAL